MDQTDDEAPEQGKVMALLNWMYEAASGDFDVSDAASSPVGTVVRSVVGKRFIASAEELAAQYRAEHGHPEVAIFHLVRNQVRWITGSSFALNLPGVLAMPVTLPTNLVSAMYLQLRLVQTIAVLRGYDLKSAEVRAMVFVCLLGSKAGQALKAAGVAVSGKVTKNLLKSLSANVLRSINQQVGFRLFTKAGTTGVVNIASWLPLIGGVVGGSIDYIATRAIAHAAQHYFTPRDPTYAEPLLIEGEFDPVDCDA
jgi:hypothetical protein